MAGNWKAEDASKSQTSYIASLAQSRELTTDLAEQVCLLEANAYNGCTKGEASLLIESLKACAYKPKATVPATDPAQPLGYYIVDGTAYVVVDTLDKKHRYAKVLQHRLNGRAKWSYASGAMSRLKGLTPCSLEDAAAFGHLHGFCMVCGASLTDPKSVEAGIGPVCAKRWSA